MMDAIVQFVRNALCTAKNFNVLKDSFLYDPKVTAQYYAFPSPHDQTTPLEVLIGVTQFYVVWSASRAGISMMKGSIGKLKLIGQLLDLRAAEAMEKKKDGDKKKNDDKKEGKGKIDDAARKLVTQSILDEGDAATSLFFLGVVVLIIGISFFWLFANSFHVTETDLIGGLPGLIHALSVAEVCLLVFIYNMIKDGRSSIRRSFQMNKFAEGIAKSGKLSDAEAITVEQYGWLVDGWSPFWAKASSASDSAMRKMLTKEEEAVASNLVAFSKKVDTDVADGLRAKAGATLLEGYREYVYLILNVLAFYGYLACIIAYYYQDEAAQPSYIRAMLLWMPNDDASWLGNAVGDFAWTVEPAIILTSPTMIGWVLPKKMKKEKAA